MVGKRFVFIALSPLLLGAQSPPQSPAADVADTALAKGRYLEASDALAAAAFGPDGKVRDEDAFQMWEQVSPMLTNELDPAVLARAQPGSPPTPVGQRTWRRPLHTMPLKRSSDARATPASLS